MKPMEVRCAYCGAPPGVSCRSHTGSRTLYHIARREHAAYEVEQLPLLEVSQTLRGH
jgi:hypothetical protein